MTNQQSGNEWRAERCDDWAQRTDAPATTGAHCSLCRTTMVGADAGRSWRLSTRFGDQWGHALVFCEGCCSDMAHIAGAVALAQAVEETTGDMWS